MKTLELQQDRGGKIFLKKLIAETWNELTGDQITKYCAWYYQYRHTVFEVEDEKVVNKDPALFDKMKHLLLMNLLDLNYKQYHKLSAKTLYTLKEETDVLHFLFAENTLTRAPYRRINAPAGIIPFYHYAPGVMLKGVSFEEFIMLDKYYLHYTEEKAAKSLDILCAIMYRPKAKNLDVKSPEWNGDMREAYSPHLIDHRLKYWSSNEIALKLSIYRYYEGCRRSMQTYCPHLFDSSEVSGAREPADWSDILHGMAGGKFGPMADTKKTPYMEVLKDMDITIKNKPSESNE